MPEPFTRLTDLETLALTLWGEARGESILGKLAIACVIRNRSLARHLTIKETCLQPMQFSCFTPKGGKTNYQMVKAKAEAILAHDATALGDPAWLECYWVALGTEQFKLRDITHGADHYMTTDLLQSNPPKWASAMDTTIVLGAHTFLRQA
jgi:spore germination cell wall hydrolase CwlJ-like protein